MEIDEYRRMDEAEGSMWWYRALHANILLMVSRFGPRDTSAGIRILDAGCGTGGLMARLEHHRPNAALVGIDLNHTALALAAEKTSASLAQASVDDLPIADGTVDIIFSADVLYHEKVDPERAAREMFRVLRAGGICIVNLPAYDWLRSYHDRQVGGSRRFTRGRAAKLFTRAGFSMTYSTYWNSVLFPLMVLRRKLLSAPEASSDVGGFPPPIEAVFGWAASIEQLPLRAGFSLPFGGSVLSVGRKPPPDTGDEPRDAYTGSAR